MVLEKICNVDSIQLAQIIEIFEKMNYFNLPEILPLDRTGKSSTLNISFLVGYRQTKGGKIKLIGAESGAEGTFPNNAKNYLNRLRKLLKKLSNDCVYDY